MLTTKSNMPEIYNLAEIVDYIKSLDDWTRRKDVTSIIATILYQCMSKKETQPAITGILEELKKQGRL